MDRRLDLLLVNPGNRAQMYGRLGESLAGIEPPLWCALIAGFIRKQGYSVGIIDADAENWSPEYTAGKIAELNPLLAGIVVLGTNPSASSTPKMTAVSELLNALHSKKTAVKTILSGLHPSALPEQTLRDEKVDFVCQGEGFDTFLKTLEALRSGKRPEDCKIEGLWYMDDAGVRAPAPASLVADLDGLPFAAWDLLPMHKYKAHNWHCLEDLDRRSPYAVIFTSLGCPFNCSYCPIHAFYGECGIRFRSPEKVIEEIDILVKDYNVRNIKFLDELFVIKKERLMRLCELIIRRGYKLNIWAYARIDTVSMDILRMMKQAGVNWLCFGVESANSDVREGVAKRISQDKIREAVDMTRQAGIYALGNFIFGLPDDTLGSMRETLDMAKEINFEYVNFYVAMAYPGSELYRNAVSDGRELPGQWQAYGQYAEDTLALATKHLTSAEVLRFRDEAFREYFSNPAYIEMIRKKFGPKAVLHVEDMLKTAIRRKYA